MTRFRGVLFVLLAAGGLTLGLTPRLHAAAAPNIVLILADDMGYGDPHCYNAQSKIPTPAIDRLAAQGMRFTDAHTPTSVCTPTRYGLLTGRYCWRTALKQGVLWPWDAPLIAADRLTLPKMLQRRGYRTACIGKWHLGWEWPTGDGARINDRLPLGRYDVKTRTAFAAKVDFTRPISGGPTTRGFDTYFGDDVPNFPPYCFIENDRVTALPTDSKPKTMFGHPGPMAPGWDLTAVMPALTTRAVAFLDERGREPKRRPFFLYLPLTAPHTPIAPTPEFQGKSQAGRYGDWVAEVDATVAQVLAALRRNGLAGNTLVLFTSDNGSPARDGTKMSGATGSVVRKFGHHPSGPWRGMKSDVWEGGHRVPFIIRWPGRVKAGAVADDLICLTDVMATLAAALRFELPKDAAEDSLSFLPLLTGRKRRRPARRSLVHHSGNGTFAIREGDWKLIVGNLGSGGFSRPATVKPRASGPQGQLYNLADDPGETRNLWLDRPEIVRRLSEDLARTRREGRSRLGG